MDSFNINSFNLDGAVSFYQFTIILITAFLLSLLVSWHYNKYFPFVSRSQGMSKTLIAITLITTLVITVVKSSLALSLGLVGALSIVRFRTPIKEPFELAYLFTAIAIGLGLGAGQFSITVFSVIFLMIVLAILSKNKTSSTDSIFFVYLKSKNNNDSEDGLEKIKQLSQKLKTNIDIRRLDYQDNIENLTLAVSISTNEDLAKLKAGLNNSFKDAEISIVDGQRLVPF